MKRFAFAAALVLGLVACGSGGSTTLALRPTDPAASGISLQVSGSADAAKAVARMLAQTSNGGLVMAERADSGARKACARRYPIVTYPVTAPNLKGLDGDKVTLAIYGDNEVATASCEQLTSQFSGGFPIVGGNRRIYHAPSSGMEPTLHCAKAKGVGCRGDADDVLVTQLTGAQGLQRQAIVVFNTPDAATSACGEGGVFVKRVVGLPGESVREDSHGFLWTRSSGSGAWTKLSEPYVSARSRTLDTGHVDEQWNVPSGQYFLVGDNRAESCDSRQWGSVPAANVIGPVVQIVRDGKALKPAGIPG